MHVYVCPFSYMLPRHALSSLIQFLHNSLAPPISSTLFFYHICLSRISWHPLVGNFKCGSWKVMEVREKCDRPLLCPAMPQSFGAKDTAMQDLHRCQEKYPETMLKADLIKDRWGAREGLVKPCFLFSIWQSLDQAAVLVLSTVAVLQSRDVNAEEFSSTKLGPNLQGLSNQGLAILQESFSVTTSANQLGSQEEINFIRESLQGPYI